MLPCEQMFQRFITRQIATASRAVPKCRSTLNLTRRVPSVTRWFSTTTGGGADSSGSTTTISTKPSNSKLPPTDPRVVAMYSPDKLTAADAKLALEIITNTLLSRGGEQFGKYLQPNSSAWGDILEREQLYDSINSWWRVVMGYSGWVYPQLKNEAGQVGILTFPSSRDKGVVLSLFTDVESFNVIRARNQGVFPEPIRFSDMMGMTSAMVAPDSKQFVPGRSLTAFSFNPTTLPTKPFLYLSWPDRAVIGYWSELMNKNNEYQIEQFVRAWSEPNPSERDLLRRTNPEFANFATVRLAGSEQAMSTAIRTRTIPAFTSYDYWPQGKWPARRTLLERATGNPGAAGGTNFTAMGVSEVLDFALANNTSIAWNVDTEYTPPVDAADRAREPGAEVPFSFVWRDQGLIKAARDALKDQQKRVEQYLAQHPELSQGMVKPVDAPIVPKRG